MLKHEETGYEIQNVTHLQVGYLKYGKTRFQSKPYNNRINMAFRSLTEWKKLNCIGKTIFTVSVKPKFRTEFHNFYGRK